MRMITSLIKNFLLWSILLVLSTHLAEPVVANAPKDSGQSLISFELADEKLIDIINRLAGIRQINILMPSNQKDRDTLNSTIVHFKLGYKIPISRAWDFMLTMLEIAGFSLVHKTNSLCEILSTKETGKSCAPLYINTRIELIKNNSSIIRYLYYFQNISFKRESSAKGADTKNKENLTAILKDMLQEEKPENNFYIDENHNSLLLTGRSSTIKSIIAIIQELDRGGFREAIEVIPVIHTSATEIKRLIDQLKDPDEDKNTFYFTPVVSEQKSNSPYFSANTRVVAIEPTNSLAIFGLYESVQRVKDFIQKYLDKSVDAEKTVLHVKPLRYLDSKKFAKTLTDFVAKKSDQSSGDSNKGVLGHVIIKAEFVETAAKESKPTPKPVADIGVVLSTPTSNVSVGGNNLIVAATQRDWKILDGMIDKLDTPQWQVALEVLIVDMTIASNHALRSQLRRIATDSQSHEFKWQSAQMAKVAVDATSFATKPLTPSEINSTIGVEADLLSTQPSTDVTGATSNYNIAAAQPVGTTIFTFKDKHGTAGILALLDNYSDVKVLSQPFIITKNNQTATIFDSENKFLQGSIDQKSMGGTIVIKNEYVTAALSVSMTPRISKHDNINLEIQVDANDFIGSSDNITKRTVHTNANVSDHEVLVLGGIAKTNISDTVHGFPIISKIPFIGAFFKSQSMEYTQRNVVIFICPTRITPVTQATPQANQFTQDKVVDITKKFTGYSQQIVCEEGSGNENFHCLGDPITDFIFPYVGSEYVTEINEFAKRSSWQKGSSQKFEREAQEAIQQESGRTKVTPTSARTQRSEDKLKNILKDEQNPFKKN